MQEGAQGKFIRMSCILDNCMASTRYLEWYKQRLNNGDLEYETDVDPAVLEPILKRVIEDHLPKANPELIYLERFQGPSPKLLGALSDVRLRYTPS